MNNASTIEIRPRCCTSANPWRKKSHNQYGDSVAALLATTVGILAGGLIAATIACLALIIGAKPGAEFYAAFSASVTMLYIASLSDVSRLRDGIFLLAATAVILAPISYDHSNVQLVSLTLLTHLLIAFVSVITRARNTLSELNLWPLLFGLEFVVVAVYVSEWA
jgi:hypothetical protein